MTIIYLIFIAVIDKRGRIMAFISGIVVLFKKSS